MSVEVKPSTIEGAGMGLFATRNISKGKLVTYYSGTVYTSVPENTVYTIELSPFQYLDGRLPLEPDHLGKFINHYPKGLNVITKFNPNKRRNPHSLVRFVASRDIYAGEEIFWDYGDSYWLDEIPKEPTV